ncbi:ACT domain-containing protein [Nocardioides euryhalodurans]|uniref:ACT domain-containing protein n=1 Tax=Nocardioides euryhalodurans TaxID=2518370 RepID=A0A4V1BDY1_9ACTN|nr:ACT domain-containing protein [Nocardioides euryhalodurans]QBR92702.1 ACT domain-containing protein [Nocardioides euryhalodurans]
MPYLLRVSLPDVPGSLGRVATAIGEAGGDIEAIEIVEKRYDGTAVDDVFLEMVDGTMPDTIVSACTQLTGVEVLWINRYAAGSNVFLDLEAVEDLTAHPARALDRLVELLPVVFRSDWAARVHRERGVLVSTAAAPDEVAWVDVSAPGPLEDEDDDLVLACPLGPDEALLIGRRGGPEFLDSELARVKHLASLARSIAT